MKADGVGLLSALPQLGPGLPMKGVLPKRVYLEKVKLVAGSRPIA